uniref:Abnormal spindle-like microcephaly-associated protein-like protein n=1 Tax=Schistosoma haematobium TaxID=6185 RepID=A0A094ZTU3_SCHHA
MESQKVRKSWFGTDRNPLCIASLDQDRPFLTVSQSYLIKKQSESDQITTQDMFSRRAVVDFGTTNFTGKSLTRFLLLVNHFDEEQSVMIQRSPPENEFTIDWITSETDNFTSRPFHPAISKRIILKPLHGRSLMKITWIPIRDSVSGGVYSFHHVIQFRVNDAYFIQAVIVGRLLPPERPSRSKFLAPRKTITNRFPNLPAWIQTSSSNSSAYCSKNKIKNKPVNSRSISPISEIHRHISSSFSTQPTTVFGQSCDFSNLTTSSFTSERPQNTDFCRPQAIEKSFIDELSADDFLLKTTETRRRSSSQPTSATPTRNLSIFGRFHEMKELSSSRQSITGSNKLCSDTNLTTDVNFLNCTATAFVSPKLVRSPALKGVKTTETRRRSSSQPTSATPTRNLSIFGRFHEMKELSSSRQSITGSNKLCSDTNLTTDVNFLNCTATAFVSPKLVRSPALKGVTCAPVSTYKKKQDGNLFYTNVTSVLSEMSVYGLTQWLNGVFAPCIAANSYNGHPTTSSKDIYVVGSSVYHSTVEKAVELLTSTIIMTPGERIEREVDNGKLTPVQLLSFRVDKGSQRRIQDYLLLNYAPIWLHLTLDALISSSSTQSYSSVTSHNACSTIIPEINDQPYPEDNKNVYTSCLSKKIHSYLFDSFSLNKPLLPIKPAADNKKLKQSSHHTTRNDTNSTKPNILPNRDILYNRHVIKRFIIFIWIIDCFKRHMLIKYDPCLFRIKSLIKSSSSLLLSFAQNFLHGENNLVRHLAYLGAQVTVNQTPLDEYQFTVENLAVDLRDGVRLVKLAELLIPTLSTEKAPTVIKPNSLMSMVRFPAIRSLIDPRDIVDGHREKTLTLLWCLLLRHQVLALLDHSALENEIHTLETNINSSDTNMCVNELNHLKLNISTDNNVKDDKNHMAHFKLLYWAALVCHLYNVPVTSLDESFTDGRALCYLLHHYLPTVLPQGLIRQCTTYTNNNISVPLPNHLLIRNNLFNLSLFQKKLSMLGDVPLLLSTPISSANFSNILPPGLVITILAYLANRLVVGPSDKYKLNLLIRDNAACIIQNAWRRFQDYINFSKLKLIPYGREWRNERKRIKASTTIQAFVRGYLVRKQVVQIKSLRNSAAIIIQSYVRRFLIRCYFERIHQSATLIQSAWRGYQARQNYTLLKKSCIMLQAFSRGFLARRYVAQLQEHRNKSATIIQSHFRRLTVQRSIKNWHKSAIQIQSAWRCYHIHQQYINLKHACLTIQRYVRGYYARKFVVETRSKRTLAATVIQSYFRSYLVRLEIFRWHMAAVQIQSKWRSYFHRQRFLSLKSWCITIQKYARGYLARERLATVQYNRNSAATVIQSHFRKFLVLRRINLWHSSALRIQLFWLFHRSRRIITQFKDIVLLVIERHNSSRMIQRWWRACFLLKFISRQRCSAIRIQAAWKGFRIRKHLLALAQSSKKGANITKISSRLDSRETHLVTSKSKSVPSLQNSKPKLHKEKCLLSLTPLEAKSLIDICFRLNKATQRAQTNPHLTLASKARNALKQLSHSTSVNQILDAIRLLEMNTGFSAELCYWIVGLSPPKKPMYNNACFNEQDENSPCALIRFFQIMMACNRSVPHEDIFIAITGIFLNIGRHKHLASNIDLWWNPLTFKSKRPFVTNENENNENEEFQPPAIVRLINTQLRRYQSLPGLCTTVSDLQLTISTQSHLKNLNRVNSVESKLPHNSVSITQNMSLVEVLMEILQRTWRARPGTVSVRLFSRTCCVLALLFNSAPPHLFSQNSFLLPTLQEIYEGLYRRSDPHSRFHLNFDPIGDSTNFLNVNEVHLKASNAEMKKLRAYLSCELDWHFRPIRSRLNPLLAIQYLLIITMRKNY